VRPGWLEASEHVVNRRVDQIEARLSGVERVEAVTLGQRRADDQPAQSTNFDRV
jgi:hypothetical protein